MWWGHRHHLRQDICFLSPHLRADICYKRHVSVAKCPECGGSPLAPGCVSAECWEDRRSHRRFQPPFSQWCHSTQLAISAANRLIGEVVQSRRRPQLSSREITRPNFDPRTFYAAALNSDLNLCLQTPENVRAGLYWWLVAGWWWCMNNGLIWSCREWWQFAAAASLYINTNHGSWQPRPAHQPHN